MRGKIGQLILMIGCFLGQARAETCSTFCRVVYGPAHRWHQSVIILIALPGEKLYSVFRDGLII